MSASVLLYGPRGCGKTLLAEATFGEMHLPRMELDHVKVLRDPDSLERAFELIDDLPGEISGILIDDIDQLLIGLRSHSVGCILLLNQLKAAKGKRLTVFGTTRRPEALLPHEVDAFDVVLPVLYPDDLERLEILNVQTRGTDLEGAKLLSDVARMTSWWSGGELEEFVTQGLRWQERPLSKRAALEIVEGMSSNVSVGTRERRIQELIEFTEAHCTNETIKKDARARFGSLIDARAEKPTHEGYRTNVHIKEVIMGDVYKTGQAGAVGPGSHAHDMNFSQIWQDMESPDVSTLGEQLTRLRAALLKEARSAEDYAAIGAVALAETEARKGNGAKSLEYLSKAGRWTFDVATKIGETVAAAAIKAALGLE